MPKTLLLADDSVTIQKVIGISFASDDVTLIAVGNGDDAIAKAKEIRPNVILADVVMPGKNGYEVCEAIKADPDLRHIPVLLLTDIFEAIDEARAQKVGAAGHIAKPFESRVLVDEVNRLFAAHAETPVETPSIPLPSDSLAGADSSDEPLDAFDDPLTEIDIAAAGTDETHDNNGELDEPGSTFAFGDADLDPLDSADDPVVASEGVDDFLIEGGDSEESLVPLENSSSSDQSFDFAVDFAVDDGPGNLENPPHAPQNKDAPLQVGVEDLADATLLDPKGASGYDVSFSDLSPPPGPDEIGNSAAGENSTPQRDSSALSISITEIADSDASTSLDTQLIDAEPGALDENEIMSAPEFITEPLTVDAEDDSARATPAPEIYSEQEPERAEKSLPREATAQAESILERIEPQLRNQLHDSLEKIAWESFGDLTETIVRQVVERVEAIAWEVIPQMAETLIGEEIRRMKGAPDEDS